MRTEHKKSPPFKESFSLVLSQTTDNQMIITTQHLLYYCIYLKILSGLDGTRTRDPLRDRQVF